MQFNFGAELLVIPELHKSHDIIDGRGSCCFWPVYVLLLHALHPLSGKLSNVLSENLFLLRSLCGVAFCLKLKMGIIIRKDILILFYKISVLTTWKVDWWVWSLYSQLKFTTKIRLAHMYFSSNLIAGGLKDESVIHSLQHPSEMQNSETNFSKLLGTF